MSIKIGDLIMFKYDGMIIEKRLSDDAWEGITPLSVVGQAMLGKNVGDKLKVHVPDGIAEIEVLKVIRA